MSPLQKYGIYALLMVCSVYVYVALRGPQGISALEERWHEIRDLQEQNAELQRDVDRRADRISRLSKSPAEQELEIRKRLKLAKPGETIFIIPAKPADDKQSAPSPAPTQ